jgi:hypothetical protein
MKQLELSVYELDAIGFVGKYLPADDLNESRVYYSIPITNGEFYYNVGNAEPVGDTYKWYLRTIHGEGYNYIHLNIEKLPELYILLSCFQAKYNFHMF